MSTKFISSTNYSQFKPLNGNRNICQSRVNELKNSIRESNKLELHPVIVDKDGFIIDGQHRIEAAKALKLAYWYAVDQESSPNDIILLNTHRRNWALKDFIYFHHQQGSKDFTFFYEMCELAKKYNSTFTSVYKTVGLLCIGDKSNLPNLIRTGKLTLKNMTMADNFLKTTFPLCKEINGLLNRFSPKSSPVLFYKSPYISVLAWCYKVMSTKQYDELWMCIKRDYKSFTDTNSVIEVSEAFRTSYNHKKGIAKFDFTKLTPYLKQKLV